MTLEELLIEAQAALSESPIEGLTVVALSVDGLPPQMVNNLSLVEGLALIELSPDSLIQTLLDAEREIPESSPDTVSHLKFIGMLAKTFMANGGPMSPEVREALGELGRCGDFRTLTEAALASVNYRRDTDGVELAEVAGTHSY